MGAESAPAGSSFEARFVVGEPTANGTPDVSLTVDGAVLGAMVFAVDAVIVPLPSAAAELVVRYDLRVISPYDALELALLTADRGPPTYDRAAARRSRCTSSRIASGVTVEASA